MENIVNEVMEEVTENATENIENVVENTTNEGLSIKEGVVAVVAGYVVGRTIEFGVKKVAKKMKAPASALGGKITGVFKKNKTEEAAPETTEKLTTEEENNK